VFQLPKNHNKFLPWVYFNKLKTSEGKPFEWDLHRYMVQPITDWHPVQGANKAGQMGASEPYSARALWIPQELHLSGLYILPSDAFVETFVKTKVNPIINKNPDAFPNVKGGAYMKQFGEDGDPNQAFLLFIGAHMSEASSAKETTSKGVAVTAHFKINDERSKSDEFIIDQANSRLLNSPYKFDWSFDNPTYPKRGSDIVYSESDQMHWFVRCSRCNHVQYLDWFKTSENQVVTSNHCFIDDEAKTKICSKCKGVLRDEDILEGFWHPKYPSKGGWTLNGKTMSLYKEGAQPFGKRGYWFNQLMYIHHSVEYLLQQEADREPSYFSNMIMGKPYIGSDVTITPEMIYENIVPHTNEWQGVITIGVDQKITELEYSISDSIGKRRVGRWKSWDELDMFMTTHDAYCVADAGPITGPVKTLCEKYKGRMWRARYKPESDQTELAKFSPKSDKSLVLIRREEFFDQMAEKYRNRQLPIAMSVNEMMELTDHYKNLYRITREDSSGNQRAVWDGASGDTDFCHADLYDQVARIKAGKRGAYNVEPVKGESTTVQTPKSTKELVKKMMQEAKR